ncbi:hypothetical protein L6164_010547 [Bauhinia variegata]|uniref:Uncharacterized protein n=1 Tax=Bauhinia variegata TaxID=167791 RepID=A0ACB9PNC0_BAUVA|nr:hypothetical protein L6164_010547 [Bauhinia variegata]
MECNKDEAARAKQIAENRMQSGDFAGALKFAMKAQKMFPEVENIVQIHAVCEVHCAAQNKLFGSEMDWYGILQTDRLADEATIKKQYRKLALLLHPDKNKLAGAEAAFKLIGEANRVVTDQAKRSLYDMKCRSIMRNATPKPTSHHSNGSAFAKKHEETASSVQSNFHSQSTGWNSYRQSEQQTFWTCCEHCLTWYQYYKTIVNATLCCQQCSRSFTAHDLGSDCVPPGYARTSFTNQKAAPKQAPLNTESQRDGRKPYSGRHDKFVRSDPVSTTKCATGVGGPFSCGKNKDGDMAAGGVKRGIRLSKPAAFGARESQTSANIGSKRARQSVVDPRESCKTGSFKDTENANVQENAGNPIRVNQRMHTRRHIKQNESASYTGTVGDDDFGSPCKKPQHDGPSEVETKEVLATNKYSATSAAGLSCQNGQIKNKASGPPEETTLNKKSKIEPSGQTFKSDLDARESKVDHCSSNVPSTSSPEFIYYPDPDFNDFEKDRAENCFAVNQLWAIYDPIDGMPRYYARVRKVLSPGFKLRITWLEPSPNGQGEIGLCGKHLPIGCGEFILGETEETVDHSMFSHQMNCVKKVGKHKYLVYPRKGEIWAIFRDWDVGLNSDSEKHSRFEFEYVEVLSDFAENVGIEIAYLGKVKGFVSVFQQTEQIGIGLYYIPLDELYRFSHRIPSFKMTGDEKEGVPRGSFELDTAALSSNLAEVGGPCDMNVENRILNTGVNSSCHESSECKAEQVMAKESSHKAKKQESNDVTKVFSILRRSPRGLNRNSMDNGKVSPSETRENDSKDISLEDVGQPKGTVSTCDADKSIKTPKKHDKNECETETLKLRRSPRDLGKGNAKIDAVTAGEGTDNHSNAKRHPKDSFAQSVGSTFSYSGEKLHLRVKDSNTASASSMKDCKILGALCHDFSKEKCEEKFQPGQIWALHGDSGGIPDTYAQINKNKKCCYEDPLPLCFLSSIESRTRGEQ